MKFCANLMKVCVLAVLALSANLALAQVKDAPQPQGLRNPAKAGYVPPVRKQGYAATVGQPQPATTPAPNTYNGKLGSVYAMEQAIARAKASGVPQNIIDQSEAVLAVLRADLAATPKPTGSPFNP